MCAVACAFLLSILRAVCRHWLHRKRFSITTFLFLVSVSSPFRQMRTLLRNWNWIWIRLKFAVFVLCWNFCISMRGEQITVLQMYFSRWIREDRGRGEERQEYDKKKGGITCIFISDWLNKLYKSVMLFNRISEGREERVQDEISRSSRKGDFE